MPPPPAKKRRPELELELELTTRMRGDEDLDEPIVWKRRWLEAVETDGLDDLDRARLYVIFDALFSIHVENGHPPGDKMYKILRSVAAIYGFDVVDAGELIGGQRGPDFCPRVGHRCEFVRKPMLAVVLPVQRRLTVGVDARVLVDSQGAGCRALHQVCRLRVGAVCGRRTLSDSVRAASPVQSCHAYTCARA